MILLGTVHLEMHYQNMLTLRTTVHSCVCPRYCFSHW